MTTGGMYSTAGVTVYTGAVNGIILSFYFFYLYTYLLTAVFSVG